MAFGDTIRIEMLNGDGKSVFGAIEQAVKQAEPAKSTELPCGIRDKAVKYRRIPPMACPAALDNGNCRDKPRSRQTPMAEDSDAEKTEPASAKRLEQAREEGDVPRSREVATFTVLMASGAGLWMTGDGLVRQLNSALVSGLTLTRSKSSMPTC
jgi:hypothetical protein